MNINDKFFSLLHKIYPTTTIPESVRDAYLVDIRILLRWESEYEKDGANNSSMRHAY